MAFEKVKRSSISDLERLYRGRLFARLAAFFPPSSMGSSKTILDNEATYRERSVLRSIFTAEDDSLHQHIFHYFLLS